MHVLTDGARRIATVRVLKVTGIRLTIRALVAYVGILAVVQGRVLNTAPGKTDEQHPHP
jgi:hypothetical protein